MSSYIPCNRGGGTIKTGFNTEEILTLTENKYINERGDSMKGDLILNGHKIKELSFPTDEADAVNKKYVDGVKKYTDLTTTRIESSLTTKIDSMESKLNNIEQRFNDKFDKLQSLLTEQVVKLNTSILNSKDKQIMNTKFNTIYNIINEMITSFNKRISNLESHGTHINTTHSIRKRAAELEQNKTLLPHTYKHFIEPSLITTNSKEWGVFMVVKIIDPYFFLFDDDNERMKWFVKCDYNSKLEKGDVIMTSYDLPHGDWYVNTHSHGLHKVKSKNIIFKSTLVQYIDLIFYEKKVDVDEVRKALRELYKDILSTRVSFDIRVLVPDGAQKNKVLFF